jgi:predicted O-methyltransferase YrrM
MLFDAVLGRIKEYPVPEGWPGHLFLLPEAVMRDLYDSVIAGKRVACLELGTGFGATSCVLAAAMQETGGKVVTIDMFRHRPVGADLVAEFVGVEKHLDVVAEALGYNWWLADRIKERSASGTCSPMFDFCLLDGAHEFEPDALAITLATRLCKPAGTIVLDDLNFRLRDVPNWSGAFKGKTDRELDSYQIGLVWDLIVRPHPDLEDFRVTHDGRIGWARKKLARRSLLPWHR